MADVRIRGSGVAACGCARLLERAGLRPGWEISDRPRVPAILLGSTAQKIFRDIFGENDLFAGSHRIDKRVVAWGGAETVTVEHSALVISERQLVDRLRVAEPASFSDTPWTIQASPRADAGEYAFGSRIASAVEVEVCGDAGACAIEALDAGWLFLIPDGPSSGWLLSVGSAPAELLDESRVITRRIGRLGEPGGAFPAYPRISVPLGGSRWLACGSAAMSFDPICGDGTGNALREAILAAAVIRAALDGGDADSLVAHYQARLRLGFERHLRLCREFYQSGRRGAWWDRELQALERGIEWCSNAPPPRFEYQLDGFDLRRIT